MSHDAECDHAKSHMTVDPDKNGNMRFRRQCLACGEATSNYIKRDEVIRQGFAIELLPLFDKELRDKYWQSQQDKRRKSFETEREARRVEYDDYLRSAEWRERRNLVLERAGGKCEGCARKRATRVHHLTYVHIRNELLFELVALCDVCHAVAHGHVEADIYASE